jgi:hypothetical protein
MYLPEILFLPTLSPCLNIDPSLSSVFRHLPDTTLGSVFAVGLRVNTFTAVIDVETLAAFQAETGFVFPADRNRLAIRVSSTLHLVISPGFSFSPSARRSTFPTKVFGRLSVNSICFGTLYAASLFRQ